MPKPIREVSLRANGRILLLAADALTVSAVLVLHFFTAGANTSSTTTLAAYAVIGVAALLVLIPFLLDALRTPPPCESATSADEVAALKFVLQQDIRDLHKSLFQRIVELKDSVAAQTSGTAAAIEAAASANAAAATAASAATDASEAATEAANAATEASQAAQALVEAPLPEERAASDVEVALQRVDAALAAARSELLTLFEAESAKTLSRLEVLLQKQVAKTGGAEADGPLPASLLQRARVIGGSSSTAVSRLIGGATGATLSASNPRPAPHSTNGTLPAEDDVWSVAEDMAAAEHEPVPGVSLAKTQPLAASVTDSAQENPGVSVVRSPDISNTLGLNFAGSDNADVSAAADTLGANTADASATIGEQTGAGNGSALIVNLPAGTSGKPFVRGRGPGLDEDIGVPLDPIAIGKWCWLPPDSSRPSVATVWLNDIRRADGGPVEILPGKTVEVSPEFP